MSSYDSIDSITIENNCNTRIISSYIVEEKEVIALFFVKTSSRLCLSFYTYNFTQKGIEEEIASLSDINAGTGIFFKSVYLDNLKAAVIYFLKGSEKDVYFKIYEFYDDIYGGVDIINKIPLIEKTISDYNFKPNITLKYYFK